MKITYLRDDHVCAVCGAKATLGVADLLELPPFRGIPDRKRYRRWQVTALTDFCEAHARDPVRTERSTR